MHKTCMLNIVQQEIGMIMVLDKNSDDKVVVSCEALVFDV